MGAGPASSVLYPLHPRKPGAAGLSCWATQSLWGSTAPPRPRVLGSAFPAGVDTGDFVVSARGGSESHCSPTLLPSSAAPLPCAMAGGVPSPPASTPAATMPGHQQWLAWASRLVQGEEQASDPTSGTPRRAVRPTAGHFPSLSLTLITQSRAVDGLNWEYLSRQTSASLGNFY